MITPAFALNWGDMDLMHDRYSFSFPMFPARIGMEAAGIVDKIGPDVTGIEVGERYCTLPQIPLLNSSNNVPDVKTHGFRSVN